MNLHHLQIYTALVLIVCRGSYSSPEARSTPSYQHSLEANNSGSGAGSFLQALKTALLYKASVQIKLGSGSFNLSSNDLTSFSSWTELALIGSGQDVDQNGSEIECDKGVGFLFRSSSLISLYNLAIKGCGRLLTTTSVNLTNGTNTFLQSKSALYFDSCSNLTLENVTIYNSLGMGVVMYNTNGTNLFVSNQFTSNYLDPDDPLLGGGGVVIEASHCSPGDLNCEDNYTSLETRNSSYTFDGCTFQFNRATSRSMPFDPTPPYPRNHMGLGKGGGLSVILKGRAHWNQVTIKSCEFRDNKGDWGGALFLGFGDISLQNSVVINDSFFYMNNWRGDDDFGITAGGAIRIEMVSYPADQEMWPDYSSNVSGNAITIIDTRFVTNFGIWGGAVSFVSTRYLPGQILPNNLTFTRCSFLQNKANTAAFAVDIRTWKPDMIISREPYPEPVFDSCNFSFNAILFHNITSYPMGTGVVYISGMPTKFVGVNQFSNNSDTCLVVAETYISVLDNSFLNFTSNQGQRGGALAFIGNSWLIAHRNTRFLFDGNSVGTYGLGGAVYSVHFGEHDLYLQQNCFFQYYKYAVQPSEWNATFVFHNNYADGQLNSIYTTSSASCAWPSLDSKRHKPENTAFCENTTFIFQGSGRNCSNEIATGPSEVSVSQIEIQAIPGWNTSLGIKTLNDYGQVVPPVLTATPSHGFSGVLTVANSTRYITDDGIVLQGKENQTANLLLMTLGPRIMAGQVQVTIKPCPPGFVGVPCKDESKTCDCVCASWIGIKCNNETKQAILQEFYCITSSDDRKMVVAACPYNQKNLNLSNLSASQLTNSVCGQVKRTSYLCSKCISGTGVAINRYDYECVPCRGREKYNWLLFLLVELVPITIVCFIVALFRVSIMAPSINGFVFFSQIISVSFYHNSINWFFGAEYVNHSLVYPVLVFYGIWNLDFFRDLIPGICLHEGLSTLNVLLINYVKALYPMLLIAIFYIFIKLYDRNVRLLRFMWKPFRRFMKFVHRHRKPNTSIVDAITTIIIFSYSKLMLVSFPLITLIPIQEMGGNVTNMVIKMLPHHYYFDAAEVLHHSMANVIYFVLGILVLVVFIVFPPIFLFLYPLRITQACIGKLSSRIRIASRIFADSFFGAFRDGTERGRDCRWFAGMYLIFRIAFFSVYFTVTEWTSRYLGQQILCILGVFLLAVIRPYKVGFYNQLDVAFFSLLSLLNILSFYNYHYLAAVGKIQLAVFYVNYVLIFLPLLYFIGLVLYRVLTQSCVKNKKDNESFLEKTVDNLSTSNDVDDPTDADLPDRFLHPQDYSSINHTPPDSRTPSSKGTADKEIAKHHSDGTRLLYGAVAGGSYGSVAKQQRERHTEPLRSKYLTS